MINLLYFILLMIYAGSITYPFPSIAIFIISVFFFSFTYKRSKMLHHNKATALLQIMCYAIPLSWRNIFGGDYGQLPISWFYIFGAFLAIHLIRIKREVKFNARLTKIVVLLFFIIVYSIIPFLVTTQPYRSQAASQLIILTFHHVIILIAILKGGILNEKNILTVKKSYISSALITSIGIITQYILFSVGINIGLINYYLNRSSFNFLFSDASHASLYLTTAAFLSMLMANNIFHRNIIRRYFPMVLILIGAATTSARTGLVVFFALYFVYSVIAKKGVVRKLLSILSGVAVFLIAYNFFNLVRPQSGLSETLFNTSGRTSGYITSVDLFLEKPFLGYGFSVDGLSKLIGQPVPHFSFLQYLLHGGILFAVMVFAVLIYSFFYSRKNNMNISWLIIMTLIGTSLIPDIFSTRYITLLILIVFLKDNTAVKEASIE